MKLRRSMWHLIRINHKKDTATAMEVLKASELSFLPISSLMEQHRPQPAIANLLYKTGGDSFLFINGKDKNIVHSFLNKHKELFKRVRCRTGKSGHVELSEETLDQFILFLQTPETYKVVEVNELPCNESLKSITLPYGPLQGLSGKYLDTKTPGGKRFYLSVLSQFHIEIRIPIKDIKRSKQQLSVCVKYLTDDMTPHWYLLSCLKKEYIERLLGDTLNPWQPGEEQPVKITNLSAPDTGQTIPTTRYLYQALYIRRTKDKTEEVNLMPHYFFFKTNRYDLETFRASGFNSHIYIMRNSDGTPIRIPEAQINLFARFLKERSEATEALYEDYQKGDTAHIAMGVEKDNEIKGTVEVITRNHYILISENGFKVNVRKKKR